MKLSPNVNMSADYYNFFVIHYFRNSFISGVCCIFAPRKRFFMHELSTEDHKILVKIRTKFNKAVAEYGLIEENDHILIGLSGGKDSLALLILLSEKAKLFVPRFRLSAVHVLTENIPYESDLPYLKHFAESRGVTFVEATTRFDIDPAQPKSNCFLCSWNRRKKLFDIAKELGCNKIALGHHLDDMVETLLMNVVYQGAFATMPPKLKMDKFDMTIIRPLALIPEKSVVEMERIFAFRKQFKNCPYEKESSRSDVKKLVAELEKWNPDVRQSIWRSMENPKPEYLPQKIK